MLVEDMRAELSRMHEKIDSIHKKTKHITDTYDEMEAELNRYKRQIQLQKEELLSTAAAKEELVSEATKAKEQTKTLILQHQQKMQEKQR
jgi:methyl-accepting chemotaxis protein